MKISIRVVLVIVLVILVVQIIGMWNGRGTLITFIEGQFPPGTQLEKGRGTLSEVPEQKAEIVRFRLDRETVVNTTAPEYISFSLDTSQIVGGKWWNPEADTKETGSGTVESPLVDFKNPLLNRLARALSPAYLRIGGSEADKVYYDMEGKTGGEPPEGYESVLLPERVLETADFAERNNLEMVFTVNTGPSSRRDDGSWDPSNAEKLVSFCARNRLDIDVWELGNELNLFWYIYSLGNHVDPEQYAKDLKVYREMVKKYYPEARVAGQSSAFWPVLGEPLGFFFGYMKGYLKHGGEYTDIVSWHYYPQQSRRGVIGSRRAYPARLLKPWNLNEAGHWADYLIDLRKEFSPGRPIWLAETGNAQYGGEPGVSDRYIAGLWWLDQLGLLARKEHKVIVRQTLVGMHYGMLDNPSMAPRPDFWNSLLWKKLMGTEVLSLERLDGDRQVRAYAHRDKEGLTVLVINHDPEKRVKVQLEGVPVGPVQVYRLGTRDILGKELYLNGRKLEIGPALTLPELKGRVRDSGKELVLNPLSYAFVRY